MSRFYILTTCVAAWLFTACSNEDLTPTQEKQGKQVNFVIDGPVTRTTTDNNNSTEFVAGDRIGIYATKGASGNNAAHEVGSNGTLTAAPDEGIYYNSFGDQTADFYAYYPHGEQSVTNQVNFTVGKDQSTEALFNASDFLTAESLNNPVNATESIALKFRHRLALVQLEVVLATGVTAPESVLLNQCLTSVTWKYKEGTLTTGGDAADIRMCSKNTDGTSYWALVPQQTIATKTKLLTLTIDGKTFIFTTANEIALKENTIKKFKIGIGEDGKLVVFSTDLTVEKWTEDNEVIEGEGELLKPSTLLEVEDFTDFTFTDIDKNKEQITAAGWYRFWADQENEIVEVEDFGDGQGKVMHIKRAVNSWHNGAFYYCVENVVAGKYELKFKAKSSEAENMKANQLRIGAYMQTTTIGDEGKTINTDYFAIIEKGDTEVTTVYSQALTFDQYDEYTLTFNLGKVSTVHNGTASNVTEESKSVPTPEMLKKVVLYISANTINTDFYVDDISWKPL